MEDKSLAYELLEEVKKTNKRLFILCIVELVMLVGIVVGHFIYESQYELVDETYTQEVSDNDSSSITQSIGE